MGFWSWLFGSKEARAEREALYYLQQKEHERRMTDYHIALVREALLDISTPVGFSLKINDQFEMIVVDALARYATVPYAIYKTADEDMIFCGECKIHVCYIQFPVGSVATVASQQQVSKSSDTSNAYSHRQP
jgi:hypothetical protein